MWKFYCILAKTVALVTRVSLSAGCSITKCCSGFLHRLGILFFLNYVLTENWLWQQCTSVTNISDTQSWTMVLLWPVYCWTCSGIDHYKHSNCHHSDPCSYGCVWVSYIYLYWVCRKITCTALWFFDFYVNEIYLNFFKCKKWQWSLCDYIF